MSAIDSFDEAAYQAELAERIATIRAERQQATIQGLRELVSFLEKNPEFTPPMGVYVTGWHCDTLAEMADKASRFGTAKKEANDYSLSLRKELGGSVILALRMDRENACTRVETGTEEVVEEVIVTPAVTETRTVTKPKYTWECPPSILAATGS